MEILVNIHVLGSSGLSGGLKGCCKTKTRQEEERGAREAFKNKKNLRKTHWREEEGIKEIREGDGQVTCMRIREGENRMRADKP